MADIWAKIGGALKKGGRATKDLLFLVPKALIYPIKKPFASWSEMTHDAKLSLKEAVGMDVPEKEKKYDQPIETTEASKNLSVEISYKDGKIKFLASTTLMGDIPYLTPEQLDKIGELNKKNKYSSIAIFKEENKVVIEVDVKEINNKIKTASKNKKKSPKEVRGLIIEQIKQKVDSELKGLGKITGGEFKVHTDEKLLYGIAEKLYREYDELLSKAKKFTEKSPEQSSEAVVPDKSSNTMKSSENVKKEDFNMTNPLSMYCRSEVIVAGRTLESSSREQQIKEQAKGLEVAFNLENVSSKTAVGASPTPSTGNNKRDSGGRSLS